MWKISAVNSIEAKTSFKRSRLHFQLLLNPCGNNGQHVRYHSAFGRNQRLLLSRINRQQGQRFFVRFALQQALKLRYWLAAGAFGGSVAAKNRYEEWKENLPEFSLPKWAHFDEELLNRYRDVYQQTKNRWSDRERYWMDNMKNKIANLQQKWQKSAVEGRTFLCYIDSTSKNSAVPENNHSELTDDMAKKLSKPDESKSLFSSLATAFTKKKDEDGEGQSENEFSKMSETERIQKLQEEMFKTQSQYQRELEKLEKENKGLRQRILLKDQNSSRGLSKIKRSLIDMYSEVLDLLNDYDSSYNTADNLPRIVVVGDQSAGKTSVLEVIARARIFPRGSGEMMTRAPVKVTLSEGPYHIASFKDSSREFDLTKESDLRQLRNEIEIRMKNSVAEGKTISNEVIALTVKGPSLPRMVLIDLPGVISTVTVDMAKETKNDIIKMCKSYMENPNAIILCIQDGSVDAERSNVTDLVSNIDPAGERTILVLTKVDLAEKNFANPDRIKKILEGKLFPMKALGYFAVVTGKDSSADSIDTIVNYEEEFFAQSKLFKDGVLKTSQMTTRNMSFAVSECFWRMVKDSVEAQADSFRAARFNLETEWRNNFPKIRELDRDELFEKARGEILDEIVNLSLIQSQKWDEILQKKFWAAIDAHIFDQILMPASAIDNAGTFNTLVDIKLKHWADKELADKSIQIGWEALTEVFKKQMDLSISSRKADRDEIFDRLKEAVLNAALNEHHWDAKARDYLRVIQLSAMEDKLVPDKKAWEGAVNFMIKGVEARLSETKRMIEGQRGPSFWSRWLYWMYETPENNKAKILQEQMKSLLQNNPDHPQTLLDDDILIVRRNIETLDLGEISNEMIRKQWKLVFREHFLERQFQTAVECRGLYSYYKRGLTQDGIDCQAIMLFYRLEKMINLTCNALRQQITNTEQRRLEKEIKEVLDDWAQDNTKKLAYLTGRRVELAEELKTVRRIQEKLEEFIVQLQHEKSA